MTSSSKKVTSRKLLASAGALSVVAGSLGTIPAAFANAPTEQLGGGARQEAQQPAQQPAQQQGQANHQQQPAQQQGQTGNQQQGQGQAEQSKDLAGQYQSSQSAYSAKNNKAWKTYSSYDSYRAGCVTRVNADTQQVEATVQLPGARVPAPTALLLMT